MKSLRKVNKKYRQNYWQGVEKLCRSSSRWPQGRLGPVGCAALSVFLLLLLACLPSPGHTALRPPSAVPEYNLEVSFDLPRGKIRGQVVIQAPPGKKLVIDPGDLNLIKVEERGRRLAISRGREGEPLVLVPQGPIHLTYEMKLKNLDDNRIDERGLFLQGMWYPQVEGFCRFKLTAVLPAGFLAVSEADRIIKEEKAGQVIFHFDFPYPLHESDGISLVASNQFVTSHSTFKNVEIWTYLLPEEAPLAAGYLERTKVLLEKYENLLGPFPYRRFAIVESFLKPSLALPTYVLMNREKLHQKDPENSPLDHELVHQWFGCSVSPDYERGNWSEGLTTYFSSHLQHEEKREDWSYRRTLLADFQSQVRPIKEYPLRKFSECCGPLSRAIGYGKGALVFHMLRQQVGDEKFFGAIRQFFKNHQFAVASWTDLQRSFESVANQNVTWFFRQWVDEVGLPNIVIKEVNVKKMSDGFAVNLVLRQDGRPKRLPMPVTFKGQDGERSFQVELDRGKKQYSFRLDFPPQEVVIDEHYSVFRRLLPAEQPPSLASLWQGKNAARSTLGNPRGIRRLLAEPSDFRAARN
jgi:aminopeptidase N